MSGPPSGRNVVRSLVLSWIEAFPEDDMTLLVRPTDIQQMESEFASYPHISIVRSRGKPHGVSVLFGIRKTKADFLVTQNFAPLTPLGSKKVVFVHDVIYRRHPEWFTRAEQIYLWVSLLSLRRADLILTSSESEATAIRKEVPRRRVVPIGLGLPLAFERTRASAPSGFEDDTQFYLAVGRLNARKNIVLAAVGLINSGHVSPTSPLVIVGSADGLADNFDAIRESVANGSIQFAGQVSDSELRWFYEHTKLFVFPSLDEGFGLPILEASACGTNMILSDIPAFRELAPDAHFFNPRDAGSVGTAASAALAAPRTQKISAPSWSDVVRKARRAMSPGNGLNK
jgi:glycosyltransferase involved in cell wall biosynthesis